MTTAIRSAGLSTMSSFNPLISGAQRKRDRDRGVQAPRFSAVESFRNARVLSPLSGPLSSSVESAGVELWSSHQRDRIHVVQLIPRQSRTTTESRCGADCSGAISSTFTVQNSDIRSRARRARRCTFVSPISRRCLASIAAPGASIFISRT